MNDTQLLGSKSLAATENNHSMKRTFVMLELFLACLVSLKIFHKSPPYFAGYRFEKSGRRFGAGAPRRLIRPLWVNLVGSPHERQLLRQAPG
jgi:hypothetical protein